MVGATDSSEEDCVTGGCSSSATASASGSSTWLLMPLLSYIMFESWAMEAFVISFVQF